MEEHWVVQLIISHSKNTHQHWRKHRETNSCVESLWMIMMCEYAFINCNKHHCGTRVSSVEWVDLWMQKREHRNSVLSVQFCCESKIVLKNKIHFFKKKSCLQGEKSKCLKYFFKAVRSCSSQIREQPKEDRSKTEQRENNL